MKSDLAVGVILVLSSLVGFYYVRRRPEKLTGLTPKQANWCCAIGACGGAVVRWLSLSPFSEPLCIYGLTSLMQPTRDNVFISCWAPVSRAADVHRYATRKSTAL